jgi:hypothetical protein
MRRAADGINLSSSSPISAHALFIASVTVSGECPLRGLVGNFFNGYLAVAAGCA